MNSYLDHYQNRGYKKVQGWFSGSALQVIRKISDIQVDAGLHGGLCEIGVHHGRSFIMLHLLSMPEEICVAYDLFEDQEQNKDRSGQGDRKIFLENLKRHRCDPERIRIHAGNSLELSAEDIAGHAGDKIRLFSVDGGHEATVVSHDLNLAEASLCPGGVVIVDDFFDQRWPGVAEGTCRYLLAGKSALYPFAIFDDKILFTNNTDYQKTYLNRLRELEPAFIIKDMQFFNQNCLVLFTSGDRLINRLRRSNLWQRYKTGPLAGAFRRIIRS